MSLNLFNHNINFIIFNFKALAFIYYNINYTTKNNYNQY